MESKGQSHIVTAAKLTTTRRFVILACLIFAGEMIFALPFHVARFFRPTLLGALELDNTGLGDAFAFYGVLAMLAYFPGGAIADRFAPRRLMTLSLFATAVGGLYFAQLPSAASLYWLYGYWGVTTILLFWSPMIKATRSIGGSTAQGQTFGLLDAGRGLAAAAIASVAVYLLAGLLPADLTNSSGESRREAMRAVIYFYSAATVLAGILVWLFVPDQRDRDEAQPGLAQLLHASGHVLRLPSIWLQAGVVVCAYCGYKAIDNYSIYAVQVLQMSEVDAARFIANSSYLRPVGAIVAGLLADRFGASRVVATLFALLAVIYAALATLGGNAAGAVMIANQLVTFFAVFALRGVYFALLQENRIPTAQTGTAVGVISVLGFTPDIFFYPIASRLLDATPGAGGFVHYFALLTVLSVVGLVCALILTWRRPNETS